MIDEKSLKKYYHLFLAKKLDYLLLFLVLVFYYGKIQWVPYLGDPDGFYHAKITWFLSQGKIIRDFPWMQFSSLRNNFTDHHFLYHILLVPFIYIKSPLIGLKIATVFFTSSSILVFYWLLKRFKIIWPFLFALLFITMEGANFRLSLVKANSLSLIMIWLIIYALFKNQKIMLLILGFLFVWLYGGWPLAILIFMAFILAEKIYDKIHKNNIKIFFSQIIDKFSQEKRKHKDTKLFLYLLGGLFLGILINPYWPKNLYLYYQQIIQIGIINSQGQFPVGGEWYGTSIMNIMSAGPHIFVALTIISLVLLLNPKKASRLTIASFLLTLLFMVLTLKSRRYIEYFMPLELLFVASGFTDLKEIINIRKLEKLWNTSSWYLKTYLLIVIMVFATLIMPPIYQKTLNTKLSERWPMDKFEQASYWLKNNSPDDAIVFHSDWDEWPALFYFNDSNYYIVGLDPTFMENFSPSLHELYREITYGNIKYNLAKEIEGNFQASYIFIEKKDHQKLIGNLSLDSRIKEVYQDDLTIIYKIY